MLCHRTRGEVRCGGGCRIRQAAQKRRFYFPDEPQIQSAPPMMSEENPRAAMNLRGKQELLDLVFDFMRRHCL
jgi:hypothetical protein